MVEENEWCWISVWWLPPLDSQGNVIDVDLCYVGPSHVNLAVETQVIGYRRSIAMYRRSGSH